MLLLYLKQARDTKKKGARVSVNEQLDPSFHFGKEFP